MIKAAPYIVLGIFATISIVLYIAGCAIDNNWYLLFSVFPLIFAIFFSICFATQITGGEIFGYEYSDGFCANHCLTIDFNIFAVVFFAVSTFGLPAIFYHCGTIGSFLFWMHLGGDISSLLMVISFIVLSKMAEE